jgi:hypothetical protein
MPPKKSFEAFRRVGFLQKKVLELSDEKNTSKTFFWDFPGAQLAPKFFSDKFPAGLDAEIFFLQPYIRCEMRKKIFEIGLLGRERGIDVFFRAI